MLSYLITEQGHRCIQDESGAHTILSKVNLELGSDVIVELETGLIINFDATEFVLVEIDDSFNNILDIINPLIEVKGLHLILQIKNLTKDTVTINQGDKICKFRALEMHEMSNIRVELTKKINEYIEKEQESEKSSEDEDTEDKVMEDTVPVQVVTEEGEVVSNPTQITPDGRVLNINPDEAVLNIQDAVPLISLQENVQSIGTIEQITSVNQNDEVVPTESIETAEKLVQEAGDGVITVEQEDSNTESNDYDILSRSSSNTSDDMSKSVGDLKLPDTSTPEPKLEVVEESKPVVVEEVKSVVEPVVAEEVKPAVVEPVVAEEKPVVEPIVAEEKPVVAEVKPKRKYQKKKVPT